MKLALPKSFATERNRGMARGGWRPLGVFYSGLYQMGESAVCNHGGRVLVGEVHILSLVEGLVSERPGGPSIITGEKA